MDETARLGRADGSFEFQSVEQVATQEAAMKLGYGRQSTAGGQRTLRENTYV